MDRRWLRVCGDRLELSGRDELTWSPNVESNKLFGAPEATAETAINQSVVSPDGRHYGAAIYV